MSEPSVRLEPIGQHHAAAVQRLASDPAIGATSNVPSPYPDGGAEAWIASEVDKRTAGRSYAFAVLDATGEVVGVVTLVGVDLEAGTAGLGYWIGVPYWGRGYATAAARACVRYAREALGLRRIGAACLERNRASRRVLEKAGFEVVGPGKPDPRGLILRYEQRVDAEPA
ncbi:MAG: GNAT family N-acetyltransferase [Bacteroidota bacterium]